MDLSLILETISEFASSNSEISVTGVSSSNDSDSTHQWCGVFGLRVDTGIRIAIGASIGTGIGDVDNVAEW